MQGTEKVPAIKLLVENTSYGTKEAKDCVDAVQKGGKSVVGVKNCVGAETLAGQLRALGAVVPVES